MMNVTQLVLVIAFALPYLVATETLYEALSKDKQLSEFYKMVNKDEVLQVLLDRRIITIFAPTNEAVKKGIVKSPIKDETKLASFHVLNLLARKNIFPASVAPYMAGVAPLFLSMKETEKGERKQYFVNNAKIIREGTYKGTEGGVQLLYVIDELLEPYKPITTLPPTAVDLLKQPSIYNLQESLDAFSSRVTEDKDKDVFNRVGNHTFFLPVGSVNTDNFNKLQDIDELVVRGHVIAKHVLFIRTMSLKCYKSETYNENLKVELTLKSGKLNADGARHDEDWYIQSNTIHGDARHRKGVVRAKIVKANIPVSNGVVHLISHPLMVIDKTIFDFIDMEKEGYLSEFYEVLQTAPDFAKYLKTSSQKTLFAPSDRAFRAIDRLKRDKIKTDPAVATELLQLHMVMASVSTEDVWNGSIITQLTSDNKRSLYFRSIGDNRNKTLTVEGGGVNATAILADIGATNGILHVIDRVLGMPYLTVYSKLEHDPDLHTTFRLSEQEEWNRKLNDKERTYTFFVPNRKAWEDLKQEMPSEHKQLHLGEYSYHVQKILDRHLVVGSILTKDDLEKEVKTKIQMVHGFFEVSTGYQDGKLMVQWEGLTAHIVRPDVKATNGIIHVIDRVMMKRRDLTKSGAMGVSSFPFLVFFLVIIWGTLSLENV